MNFRKLFIIFSGSIIFLFLIVSTAYYVGKRPKESKNVLNGYLYELVESIVYPIRITRLYFQNPEYYIQNNEIKDGIHFYEENQDIDNILLLTSYNNPEIYTIELLDLKKNKSIKKWYPNLKKITEITKKGLNKIPDHVELNRAIHPVMLNDSSIIFNTIYSLVKLNSNSEIVWIASDYHPHHSIEPDHEGNIWLSSKRLYTDIKGLIKNEDQEIKSEFYDDLIMKIDPETGEVLFEKSVINILKENNLYNLIFRNGNYEMDPIHLNDVQPALFDGNYWKKGDLLLSARHLSSIILYRPSTNKILWYKQGPWLNQHDPNFLDNDKISVFGNQVFRLSPTGITDVINHPSTLNKIFIYDFKSDSITEPYKKLIESEGIFTPTEGRSKILPNGDIFIEETDNGKIIIGNRNKKKISFAKRINSNYITHMNWSRIIIKN